MSLAAVISVGGRDEARRSDVVVVLGAAQYAGRPSPVLRARLDHAIALWRRQVAPRIMLTGGTHTERTRHLLKNAHIPVVETWDLPADPINHVVGFSNAEATNAMVHHLHQRGYREIGFIGGGSTADTRGS